MKKAVALGIAGATTLVVAAWRRIQRDNDLESDTRAETRPPEADPAPTSAASPKPGALFTPSVNEKSTKAELYEVATDMGIDGRSKMNKTELLEAIRSAS